eukprot:2970317-Pleurochrysis_carterae.AAC.1
MRNAGCHGHAHSRIADGDAEKGDVALDDLLDELEVAALRHSPLCVAGKPVPLVVVVAQCRQPAEASDERLRQPQLDA